MAYPAEMDAFSHGIVRSSKVLVTGASGFLGMHVVRRLRAEGFENLILPTHREYDLTCPSQVRELFKQHQPDAVIHLAAKVGGIGANSANPGSFFFDNAVMGVHIIEEARLAGVKKFLCAGTVCAYPKFAPTPFKEQDLWVGYPEETNAPYGLAKKMLLVQLQAYRRQYNFNGVYLLPVNLYGPGDNFDLETSHVIPALIRKCFHALNAKSPYLDVWGSGNATREFLYVEDAAEAFVSALLHYDKPAPVNIGSGREVQIRELVALICSLVGFKGEIRWDNSKPDGQPRRCLDTSAADREFGFQAKTELRDGLTKTIQWYRERY